MFEGLAKAVEEMTVALAPEPPECSICLSALGENNTAKTRCGHTFHLSCIAQNIRANGFKCPNCRGDVVVEEESSSDEGIAEGEYECYSGVLGRDYGYDESFFTDFIYPHLKNKEDGKKFYRKLRSGQEIDFYVITGLPSGVAHLWLFKVEGNDKYLSVPIDDFNSSSPYALITCGIFDDYEPPVYSFEDILNMVCDDDKDFVREAFAN